MLPLLIPGPDLAIGIDDEENSKLSEFRKYMLDEVNFVRTKPAEYAETRLLAYKKISTDNGAYDYLKKVKPVKALVLNEMLNSAALEYAELMARKDVFGHYANGTPFERAKKAGYRYSAMAENIACGSEYHYNAMTHAESSAIGFVRMLIIDNRFKIIDTENIFLTEQLPYSVYPVWCSKN